MASTTEYLDVILFLSLYLVFSLLPYLALNRTVVLELYREIRPLGVVSVASVVAVLVVLVYGFIYAEEGVERYTSFILEPSDLFSVLVGLAFFWAAISWWAVPEIVFRYDLGLSLNVMLVIIITSQVPMVLLLTLLTAVGKTR